jgi:hypothetical protein
LTSPVLAIQTWATTPGFGPVLTTLLICKMMMVQHGLSSTE